MLIVNKCNKSICTRNKQCENNDLYMKHPYNDAEFQKDIKNPEILIIGTIPPWRFTLKQNHETKNAKLENGDIDFYYGSKDNHFWNLVELILQTDRKDINDSNRAIYLKIIIDFCNKNHWIFIDIIEECCTKKTQNGYSANDSDLTNRKLYSQIYKKILHYQNLKKIFFTSKKASECFFKTLSQEEILKFNAKETKILISPSPSGLRILGKNEEFKKWKNQNLNIYKGKYATEYRILKYKEAFAKFIS